MTLIGRYYSSRGFILIPVILTLTLLAAIAFMLSRQGAINAGGVVREHQPDVARYVAEAGMNNTIWQANAANCTGYTDLTDVSLGEHSYTTTITPTTGSPVAINAVGTHSQGVSYSIQRDLVNVYQPPTTLVIQPDAANGKDAYLWYPSTTDNYGSVRETWVSTMSNDKTVALYEFDLGAVPAGVKILSATLSLHHGQGWDSNVPISAHQITNAWNETEVSWDNRTSAQAWDNPAGDFDPQVIDTTLVGPTSKIRYEWQLKSVVEKWVNGGQPNYGVLLRTTAPNIDGERFYTSDDTDPTRHPRLTITYACECGQACAPPPVTFCEADYAPNTLQSEYSSSAIGSADAQAITYLPEGVKFNGVISPTGGAWLLIDPVDSRFYMTNMVGTLLTNLAIPISSSHGGVFISSGTYANHIALTNTSGGLVYVDMKGNDVSGTLASGSSQASGIGFVGTSASGIYDDHILILDRGSETVLIRTQDGAAVGSFSVNDGTSMPVQDVTHLPGTDKVIVTYDPGKAIIYDFSGTVLREYPLTDYGVTLAESIAINPLTCEHVVADRGSDRVITINYIDTLPLAYWKLDETSGTLAVDSVGGHDGTLNNGPVWSTGQVDGALNFDGTNDAIRVPHADTLSLTDKMTFTAWVNASSFGSSYQTILAKDSGAGNSNYYFGTWQQELIFGFFSGPFFREIFTSGLNLQPGTWYELAATFDNATSEVKLYVDGALVHSDTLGFNPAAVTADLSIGRSPIGEYWRGLLDDVRMYNSVLTASEIADIYAVGSGGGGTPPPPSGSCDGTYRDEFNAVSFAGSDGTLTWTGDWQEVGETDGANRKDVRVVNDISNYQLQLQDNDNGGEGVSREANLYGASSAKLSFDYRRSGLDNSNDYVTVEISPTGTAGPWTERGRFAGSATDGSYIPWSYTLAADEITANTAVRLLTSSNMGGSDRVYFDNIEIVCSP